MEIDVNEGRPDHMHRAGTTSDKIETVVNEALENMDTVYVAWQYTGGRDWQVHVIHKRHSD